MSTGFPYRKRSNEHHQAIAYSSRTLDRRHPDIDAATMDSNTPHLSLPWGSDTAYRSLFVCSTVTAWP